MRPHSGHFVGRAGEIEAVDALLEGLDQGRAGALLLVGEPGIGKTRLLMELAGRADARRHLVLDGTASELERNVPFAVFVDALAEYVRGLDPAFLAVMGDDVLAALTGVLPSVPGVPAATGVELAHERYLSHLAARLLLERLATHQPLVLILDDVHWADSGSLELLLALLRRPPAAAVLVAFALRPHRVSGRVATGLERAAREGTLTRLELGPLAPEEARELLPEAADPASLYAESGGNPFYLEQLARWPGAGNEVGSRLLAGDEVPASVAAALAEEIAELGDEARLVLRGAAVAGDPFEPELAAVAAAVTEEAALTALDELLDSDLVRPTDVPRRFRFRHPLVQRAVYELAPGGWRLAAHERCAEALAARGGSLAAQAQHVELSARQGDPRAVAVLRAAGESATRGAPATAARWFEGALRLLADDAPLGERVELLLEQARSLMATGRLAKSHELLLESLRLVPGDATTLCVRLTAKCAEVEHLLGRYAQAYERLGRALGEFEGTHSEDTIALMIELAINRLFQADFDGMNDWGSRAVEAAAILDDRPLAATALAVQAAGAAMAGATDVGRAKRDRAAVVIDALSDAELAGRLDGVTHLALAEMYLDCFEDSRRHADRALALSRATGQGDYMAPIAAMLGTCSWVRGRVSDAVHVLEGAVESARLVDDPQGLCWTLFNLSDAYSAAGAVEAALATGEESWELARLLDRGPIPTHAGCALGLALLNADRAERAAEVFAEAGDAELRRIGGAWRGRYLEVFARSLLAAGRRADADRIVAAAQRCADEVGLPFARAMADLSVAAVALVERDGERAAGHSQAAVEALESVGHLYDAARARLVAGRSFALAGEREQATAELERAAADFGSFGVARYRAEAERELRKLGRAVYHRSTHGSDVAGVASLTARELELARLVVDRKTNPQIAAELFLSQKTVETHLRNIFRKVGVSTRVELARAVERAASREA